MAGDDEDELELMESLAREEVKLVKKVQALKAACIKAHEDVAAIEADMRYVDQRLSQAQQAINDTWLWVAAADKQELEEARHQKVKLDAANKKASQRLIDCDAEVAKATAELVELRKRAAAARAKAEADAEGGVAQLQDVSAEDLLQQQCDETVMHMAVGKYEIRVMERKFAKLDEQGQDMDFRIQQESDQEQPEDSGVMGRLFGGGGGGGEAGEGSAGGVRLEMLKKERHNLMIETQLLGKRIKEEKDKFDTSATKMHEAMAMHTDERDLRREIKQSAINLAYKANSEEAECAEALGRLYVRTPMFAEALLGEKELDAVPPVCNVRAMSTWEACEHIDQLCQKAKHQIYDAIDQLVSFLIHDNLADMAKHHLVSRVTILVGHVLNRDAELLTRHKLDCAVAARWPMTERDQQTHVAYAPLLRRAKSSQQTDRGMQCVINEQFLDAQNKDQLLHITPSIMQALIMISRRGLVELRREMAMLAPPDQHSIKDCHWCIRRTAAGRICDMALRNNVFALEYVSEQLIHDRQWTVRQLVLGEACRILGHVDQEAKSSNALIAGIINAVFSLTQKRSYVGAPGEDSEMDAWRAVQSIAQRSLTRELPRYNPVIQRAIVLELVQISDGHGFEGSAYDGIIEQVLKPLGGLRRARAQM